MREVGSISGGNAYQVSNESKGDTLSNFSTRGGKMVILGDCQNGAQNSDFLQNRAENQNYSKGYSKTLSAVGSMSSGDANKISNETEHSYFFNSNRNSGYFGGENGAQNSDFLQNRAEDQNGDVRLATNLSGVDSTLAEDAHNFSNESEMTHMPNFNRNSQYFGAANGAQNSDFLQNRAENQNYSKGYSKTLSEIGRAHV